MILPGTKVVMHENPKHRGSCDIYGEVGWYIGPALKHYRCYHYYYTTINSPRVVDTVEIFPIALELSHPVIS